MPETEAKQNKKSIKAGLPDRRRCSNRGWGPSCLRSRIRSGVDASNSQRILPCLYRIHRLRQPVVSWLSELHVCLFNDPRGRGESFAVQNPNRSGRSLIHEISLRCCHVRVPAVHLSVVRPGLPRGSLSCGCGQRQYTKDRPSEMHRLSTVHPILSAETAPNHLESSEK